VIYFNLPSNDMATSTWQKKKVSVWNSGTSSIHLVLLKVAIKILKVKWCTDVVSHLWTMNQDPILEGLLQFWLCSCAFPPILINFYRFLIFKLNSHEVFLANFSPKVRPELFFLKKGFLRFILRGDKTNKSFKHSAIHVFETCPLSSIHQSSQQNLWLCSQR
jgi:hypothetical protein